MALEALACMEAWLRKHKGVAPQVAADLIFVAVDGYLREQDMIALQVNDVFIDKPLQRVILMLGRGERGETSKTGRDQGVTLDDPCAVDVVIRSVKDARQAGRQKVFQISDADYRC